MGKRENDLKQKMGSNNLLCVLFYSKVSLAVFLALSSPPIVFDYEYNGPCLLDKNLTHLVE